MCVGPTSELSSRSAAECCNKAFASTRVLLLDHIIQGRLSGRDAAGSSRLHEENIAVVAVDWDVLARMQDEQLSGSEVRALRTELLLNPGAVSSFVDAHPRLTREVQQMALGWARGVEGMFVVTGHDRGSALLIDETGAAYTVCGVRGSMLEEIRASGFDATDVLCVRACLIPHPVGEGEEAVIFDGLVEVRSPVVDLAAMQLVARVREAEVEPAPAVRLGGKAVGLSAFGGLVERVAQWEGRPGAAWLCARDEEEAEGTEAMRKGLLDRFFRDVGALEEEHRPTRPGSASSRLVRA